MFPIHNFIKIKTNKTWHQANKMRKNPTLEQRIKWHLEHSKNCNCRSLTEKLKLEIDKKKIPCTKQKIKT